MRSEKPDHWVNKLYGNAQARRAIGPDRGPRRKRENVTSWVSVLVFLSSKPRCVCKNTDTWPVNGRVRNHGEKWEEQSLCTGSLGTTRTDKGMGISDEGRKLEKTERA